MAAKSSLVILFALVIYTVPTVIVAVPKEKGEITDVGAAKRRRERPRKTPEVEPPDPRVLDPEKGECADPVGRDAILGVEGPGPPVGGQ